MPKAAPKKRPRKGVMRTPPCPQHPVWSTSKYRTFVRSAMRKAWMKWPPKFEALRRAQRPNQSDNKRLKKEYQCAHCLKWHRGDEVSVDHIVPWGDPWSMSFEDACRALFVGVEELRVLCNPCHTEITNEYNESKKATPEGRIHLPEYEESVQQP